ncbi:MAG: glycosyltransferase family 4 protein [Bacteroidota bacterium]
MKKVLIFTYYWPPAGGVAVQRWLKFSKYLPEFGWEPIIITVKNGSYPYFDESQLKEISPMLRVYHTKTFEPFELYNFFRGKRGKSLPVVTVGSKQQKSLFQTLSEYIRANFFIPDARKGWVPYAVKKGEEILSNEKIDVIVTTGPPHSAHLIGLKLKEKFGVKWVADFRDPWTGIFYNDMLPRTQKAKQKDKELETKVLQTADLVTVISAGMKNEFEDTARKIEVVLNGYDEEDFQNPEAGRRKPGTFTIRYVGNMMATQNIEVFWKVISEIQTEKNPISIEFIGRVDEVVKERVSKNGLASLVSYREFVDHKKAIQLMQDADLLLFVIPAVKDNRLILTGKLFEYLASKSEVISFGPITGNASTIFDECGRKKMLGFTDIEGVQSQLNDALNFFRQNKTAFKYKGDRHLPYSRKQQTQALKQLLEIL